MRVEIDIMPGDQTVSDDLHLQGMITGNCTVAPGCYLRLHGVVTGDLIVQAGARADVYGTVSGNLVADGRVEVRGMINGSASGDGLKAHPGSFIDGVQQ